MVGLTLPNVSKQSMRFPLLGGICMVTLLVGYCRLELPDLHEIGCELDRTDDEVDRYHGEGSSLLHDIFNSTLGFQKLLAVSLPERSDHRDRLILQSALSQLKIEFVDGVRGGTVGEKALPAENVQLGITEVGSWRAHLNALQQVVHGDLGSALIIEDDVDWDVYLKPLLQNFAISAQELAASSSETEQLYFHDLPKAPTNPPLISPYGDDWDLLWLGHCGSSLSEKRVIQFDDASVPEIQYLRSWNTEELTPLSIFPNHTRVVLQSATHLCSLAYAVSQKGARKILYDIGLQRLTAPFDLMLQRWCNQPENGVCMSALPQLFDHHRVKGPMSLESDMRVKAGNRDEAVTNNVRLSVAMNMQKLLQGRTDYDDQYPDSA